MEFKRVDLKKGYVLVYDFNTLKVHNYVTNDLINDQVILLEKNNKVVVIESPAFFENNLELESYINSIGKLDSVLLAYHMAGGTFAKNYKKYSTKIADDYGHNGGGKALANNFKLSFGAPFDYNIHKITDYLKEGKITLAGIELNILENNEAFDIEIPEINSIYTHMLGSNVHSIVAGVPHANQIIETLKGYIEKNYNLIFTSHFIPEDINAVKTKINYLEKLKEIDKISKDKEEFISKAKEEFKDYSGLNYLEMSAGFFKGNN